jgi:hypothetical protein
VAAATATVMRAKHKTCQLLLFATWQAVFAAGAIRYGTAHQQAWFTCCKLRGGSDLFAGAANATLETRNGTSVLHADVAEPATAESAAAAEAAAASPASIEIEVFEHEQWGAGRTWQYKSGSPAQALEDIRPSDSCEFTSEW